MITVKKLAPAPTPGKMDDPAADYLAVADYHRLEKACLVGLEVLQTVSGPGAAVEAARQYAFELTPGGIALRRVGLMVAQRIGLDPIVVAQVWADLEGFTLPATRRVA